MPCAKSVGNISSYLQTVRVSQWEREKKKYLLWLYANFPHAKIKSVCLCFFKTFCFRFPFVFLPYIRKFNLWCRLKLNYEVTLIIQTEFIIFQDSIVSTVISSTCLLFCSSFTCLYQSSSYDKLSRTFSLLYSKLLRQMRYLKIIYALLNTFSWKKKLNKFIRDSLILPAVAVAAC